MSCSDISSIQVIQLAFDLRPRTSEVMETSEEEATINKIQEAFNIDRNMVLSGFLLWGLFDE